MSDKNITMEKIVSLCKRRGFVFPGSEIYGGLANTWDYGPLGVELRKNIRDCWWNDMVRRRDWRALIHYGVIFFVLEKLGAVIGVSNLHIYAAMRGETLEAFQRTRNAPGALYSVAGKDAGNLAWDKAPPR